MIFILSFILYVLFTFCFHKLKFINLKSIFLILKNLVLKYGIIFLSPDFYFANQFKPKSSFFKREAIIRWNHLNISFPLIIAILLFFCSDYIFSKLFLNEKLYIFVSLFWFFRIRSRSIEIILAFFNDVITSKNTSKLSKFERIKLAAFSYFENILNFAIFYLFSYNYFYYYGIFSNTSPYLSSLFEELKTIYPPDQSLNIIFFISKSFYISTGTNVGGLNLFFALQILTSLTLVIFAVAGYLGNVKNKHNV